MSKASVAYPLLSKEFLGAYSVHMRPYLLFVSGAGGLLGMALPEPHRTGLEYLAAFLAFFLAYGFGQALTDCFQTDTDAISSPYRPLVQRRISKEQVLAMSLLGLVWVTLILGYLNWRNLVLCVAAIAGLATYTWSKRNHSLLGPPHNGVIVMLLPMMGYLSFSPADHGWALPQPLLLASLLSLFAYMNFVLLGYLKDISADRATGYRTFPAVFGWEKTVLAGDLIGTISVALAFWLIQGQGNSVSQLLLWSGALSLLVGQVHAHRVREKTEASSWLVIGNTVRSYILWHLAAAVAYRPEWKFLAIAYYAAFEWVLLKRPERAQI